MSDYFEESGSPHPAPSRDLDQIGGPPDMGWAKGLRVAIVHDWINGMRGGEKVLELLCGLFPDARVFTLFYEPERISAAIRSMRVEESWLGKVPGARHRYRWTLPLLPMVVRSIPTRDFDLVVSSSHCVAHGARVRRGGVHVCYCHTPMRYLYDHYDAYFGPTAPWFSRVAMGALRGVLTRWDRRASGRVTAYLCNGTFVARRIATVYGREAVAVGAPVDVARFVAARGRAGFRARESGRPPYHLCLGAIEPYKRVDLAVEAFRRLGPDHRLVVAGSGSGEGRLRRGAPENVEFRGWVPDEEVADLVAGAQSLIFPALEDFGIGPLEAAAAGVPSIALADGGALETVVEGVTGLHFLRQRPEEIAAAVLRLAEHRWNPEAMENHAARYGANVVAARIARHVRLAWERQRAGLPPCGQAE